jgi:hypothetical protein
MLSRAITWRKKREEMFTDQLQSEKAAIQNLPKFLINILHS